ncbi:DNA polymerase III subunit beta [Patescibacteria group bacterium]|nr:DNA polymerase III subunit beta [Patescibacteria group bacterium]MCG2699465.1 DNA polymerase III subunit beta [Candidatus Parcubacteria bacterium]
MKAEVLKNNIKIGLNIVEKVVGKNISLPILDNVLINTEDNFLLLTATDLETAIKYWVLAKNTKKGKIVVPVRFLANFVSLLPEEKISLEEKKQNLLLECKNYKTQIQGFNPEDFPIIPEVKDYEFLMIDNKSFCNGLAQIVDVASTSQARPEISGIYLLFSQNTLKIAATDSFRLAEKTISVENKNKKNYAIILPQKSVREIINTLGEKDGDLKICFSGNQTLFEFPIKEMNHPQVQIFSRLIEGEYPNYQEIIPKKFKTHIVAKKEEFLNHIKAASLFSGKINEIKFNVDPVKKNIEISAHNPDIGESKSSLPTKIEGEPIEISFNHKFLIDGILNIKSSELALDLNGEDGPCILKPIGDSSYIYVVMPIKST